MSSHFATAHFEYTGIEREIRKRDYLLRIISEEHIRLLFELNECNLIRGLIAARRTRPRF
jgi:hypothetical protein